MGSLYYYVVHVIEIRSCINLLFCHIKLKLLGHLFIEKEIYLKWIKWCIWYIIWNNYVHAWIKSASVPIIIITIDHFFPDITELDKIFSHFIILLVQNNKTLLFFSIMSHVKLFFNAATRFEPSGIFSTGEFFPLIKG